MTIIQSIRDYILTCPHLKLFNDVIANVNIDFSDSSITETYSIEEGVTSNPVTKKYINGDTEREYLFVFSSIEAYGSNFEKNMDNCGFYELFSEWLESNSIDKILPVMDNNKQARKIEALTNGYLFNNATDGTTARYQIQLRLTYFQKR